VPNEELLRRLAVRNSQPSQESFHISEESMRPWIEFFQRPTPEELERREYAMVKHIAASNRAGGWKSRRT
ncbi:MAG TPA: hypothetical protein VH593_04495, partial [Ktedonobacteraceae bacterium]